ncbi:flippase [Massilia varians]|uniref:flippase n=1 Tax=Massilia varians TaxID=457921 RepID=UPI002557952D|nr:flippase [Massilia varians]MDK6079270.1 flippase [Massilia varians]
MRISVKKNIFYLLCIQGGNYIFPLLLLPYLGRILGVVELGVLSYCLALIQYLILLTDFGFNMSATRRVALCRSDPAELARVYSATTAVRLILAALSPCVLWICVEFVPAFNDDGAILLAGVVAVLGNALFPIWLFQGLEQMRLLMYASFVARFLSFLLVTIFVNSSDDTAVAAACIGASNVILAAITYIVIRRKKLVQFSWPAKAEVFYAVKDGFPIFAANLATSFYVSFSPILLRLLTSDVVVGHFSTADKIRLAVQGILLPVAQALYPPISKAYQEDRLKAKRLFRKARLVMVAFASGCFILIEVFAAIAIDVVFGSAYREAIPLLRLEAVLLPIISVALVYGQLGLAAAGDTNRLAKIYVCVGIMHIFYAVPLTKMFAASGTIASIIITESIATMAITWRYRQTWAEPYLGHVAQFQRREVAVVNTGTSKK